MKEYQKKAASLSYNQTKGHAPRVTAQGKGLTAEKMIHIAKENDIPILEDPSLVELLEDVNINETIPTELYEVVAEVYSFIYRLDNAVK